MSESAILSAPDAGAARRRSARRWSRLLVALPGIVLLLGWQFAAGRLIPTAYVSKPTEIAARLYQMFATGMIWPDLLVTGEELVLSYVAGTVTGLLAGYWLGRSPRASAIFEPYIMAFYGIPKIALAPLFIIWFGIGIWSKVALAGTMVFFLVFYNMFTGVRSVGREIVDLALVLGANERQLSRHIYLPATAPFILLGMRMAIPFAVIGVIVGEFTSALKGLGLFINYAASTYDPAGVFAGIIILLTFVLVATAAADRLERRLLKWRPPLQGNAPDANT